jgi:hypothetical protein
MAMDFMDGFDYLTAANLGLKWDNSSGTLVTGAYGFGKGLQNPNQTKTLGANYATGMVGFHWFSGTTLAASLIHKWLDAGSQQVELRQDATGAPYFTRNGTTIGSVASFRMVVNTWYWIEAQVTIDPSAGVANLYINATSILAQSGLNTRNTANSYFNQLSPTVSGSPEGQVVDSYHFWDGTAGDVSGFPYGEHEIDTELADAVGSNTTWTRGGTNTGNNYSQVNEANEDGDTTYVLSATPGQIDSYGFTNLRPTSGAVGTIAVNTIDRIDDATPRTFDHFVKSASATALSSAITPSGSYVNHQRFFGTDPNTSAAWTVAGRNAAEFGYKEIS